MRKYKHNPWFTKSGTHERPVKFHFGRRRHRLVPAPVPNTTLEKAKSRVDLYLNSSPARNAAREKAATARSIKMITRK